jgi:hypothetical protein
VRTQWLKKVGASEIMKAERKLLTELRGFEKFDPYTKGRCVFRVG